MMGPTRTRRQGDQEEAAARGGCSCCCSCCCGMQRCPELQQRPVWPRNRSQRVYDWLCSSGPSRYLSPLDGYDGAFAPLHRFVYRFIFYFAFFSFTIAVFLFIVFCMLPGSDGSRHLAFSVCLLFLHIFFILHSFLSFFLLLIARCLTPVTLRWCFYWWRYTLQIGRLRRLAVLPPALSAPPPARLLLWHFSNIFCFILWWWLVRARPSLLQCSSLLVARPPAPSSSHNSGCGRPLPSGRSCFFLFSGSASRERLRLIFMGASPRGLSAHLLFACCLRRRQEEEGPSEWPFKT